MNILTAAATLTSLALGGENIGFGINSPGLYISGTYEISMNGKIYNPINEDIKEGDIILIADNKSIDTSNDLYEVIKNSNDDKVSLSIERKGKVIERELKLFKDKDKIKTGLYIKEESLGIGTITYFDPNTSSFAALGHPAKENDGSIIKVKTGSIYDSKVNGITKSKKNKVGQKVATLEKEKVLGEIVNNNEFGISGLTYEIPKKHVLYEIASPEEISLGKAKIYTVLNDHKKESFDIDITGLKRNEEIKGISFKITDERLLNMTGGIIAGMSGSPIVQNNKIIGAITHAITSDPTKGYGIFITSMINGLK